MCFRPTLANVLPIERSLGLPPTPSPTGSSIDPSTHTLLNLLYISNDSNKAWRKARKLAENKTASGGIFFIKHSGDCMGSYVSINGGSVLVRKHRRGGLLVIQGLIPTRAARGQCQAMPAHWWELPQLAKSVMNNGPSARHECFTFTHCEWNDADPSYIIDHIIPLLAWYTQWL